MASVCRTGILRIVTCTNSGKLLPNRNDVNLTKRSIYGKGLKSSLPPVSKPKPWPYKEKGYNFFNSLYDKTTSRLDDNSKIIVVEGPVASGKTELAKQLACELDMLYLPEANQDMLYTNAYGYNLKRLDSQLPESVRSFDIPDFLLNPRHRMSGTFQLRQYVAKYSQYIDALAHVLSTGQGVILERCVYSDFVFMEAMLKKGYISKTVASIYYDARKCTIGELLKPHLVIYLDIPIDRIADNIKKRNYACEKESEVLCPTYLKTMEEMYKQNYLKTISVNSELLVYDWSDQGDIDVVVEDIERINFSRNDIHDPKFEDWVYQLEEEWAEQRNKFADKKEGLLMYLNIPRFDAPELIADADDMYAYREVCHSSPGNYYEVGFDSAMGDKGILFKTKVTPQRETLPLIERCLK